MNSISTDVWGFLLALLLLMITLSQEVRDRAIIVFVLFTLISVSTSFEWAVLAGISAILAGVGWQKDVTESQILRGNDTDSAENE